MVNTVVEICSNLWAVWGNIMNCYENVSPIGKVSPTKYMKVEIFINLYMVLWWCISIPVEMFLRENEMFELLLHYDLSLMEMVSYVAY
mgnify:CR=1 FL=1